MNIKRLPLGEVAVDQQARIRIVPYTDRHFGWSCDVMIGLLWVTARHRGEYRNSGAAEAAALAWAEAQGAVSAVVELASSERSDDADRAMLVDRLEEQDAGTAHVPIVGKPIANESTLRPEA